jgi:ribonuclease Z
VLNLAGIAVDALSIGGLETCIQLPGLDLAFDMGRCPPSAVHRSTVCFTHAHIDHMGSVVHHCATRALTRLTPPTYLVPEENVAAFHDLLEVWRRLDHSALACEVVPVRPGSERAVRPGLVAIPFRSPHRVPCLGYGLWEERNKLKPELRGLDGDRLRELKQAGHEITDRTRAPIVAFTGDSLIDVVEREAVVREARLLIMEVTFVDDRVSVAQCRDKGHIHIDEVIERAELFQNQAILFTHLSARYRVDEAQALVAQRLPASLKDRVTLLVAGRS